LVAFQRQVRDDARVSLPARARPVVLSLSLLAACRAGGASPDGGAEGGPPPDGAVGLCAEAGITACGGDLTGVWNHLEFCDLAGQPASQPMYCVPPWEQTEACAGAGNSSDCRAVYRGTLEFAGAGEALVDLTVAGEYRFVVRNACVDQLRTQGGASDRCRALSNPALDCRPAGDRCECNGASAPVAVALAGFRYELAAPRVTFRTGDVTATGSFCASSQRLVVRFDPPGFEGFSAWILTR
jgi:hypothetical protein